MGNVKLIYSVFIIILLFNSCKKDDELIKISELGFVKKAILNDENADGFVQIGETITYTFEITNTGQNSISDIKIDDDRIGIQDLLLIPSELGPGDSASISEVYEISQLDMENGSISNQATVSGIDNKGETILDLSDDESNSADRPTFTIFDFTPYEDGFFVLNEGNFGFGNASVTFVSNDFTSIEQEVFKNVNGIDLGDTAQSMFMFENYAYILVNGSDKIEIANRYTMEHAVTIEDIALKNPRYMIENNRCGYVSIWGEGPNPNDDAIVIINLDTNEVAQTIPIGFVPNKMLKLGNKLFVTLQGWYPDINDKVAVIDLTNNTLIQEIVVGDYPDSLVSNNDFVYVLSGGKWGETGGKISKIDSNTLSVVQTLDFATDENPTNLLRNDDVFYYSLNGQIYKWDGISNTLPSLGENGLDGNFYSTTLNNGFMYATDAGDFVSEGSLQVFDLSDNSNVQTLATGIIPNGVTFN